MDHVKLPAQTPGKSRREYLTEVFRLFDVSKSGSIQYNEFMTVLELMQGGKISSSAVTAILEECDSDLDGHIGEDEFVQFFAKMDSYSTVEKEMKQSTQKNRVHKVIMAAYFGACFIGFGVFVYIYLGEYKSSVDGTMRPPYPHEATKLFEIAQLGLAVTGSAILVGVMVGIVLPIMGFRVANAQSAISEKIDHWKDQVSGGKDKYIVATKKRALEGSKDIRFSYRKSVVHLPSQHPTTQVEEFGALQDFSHNVPASDVSNVKSAITDVATRRTAPSTRNSSDSLALMDQSNSMMSEKPLMQVGFDTSTRPKMAQTWSSGFDRQMAFSMHDITGKYEPNQYDCAKMCQDQNDMIRSGGFNPMTNSHAFKGHYRLPQEKYMTWGPGGWKKNLESIPNCVKDTISDIDSKSDISFGNTSNS